MINIYDTANQLEREMREIPQYKAVKDAYAAIDEDATAKGLYDDYRKVQDEMHGKMMQGAMPTPEDQEKLQEMGEKIKENDLIMALLAAEQQFSGLMDEINKVIMAPIREIYEGRK